MPPETNTTPSISIGDHHLAAAHRLHQAGDAEPRAGMAALRPETLTCSRSTEESTKRTVPPALESSPSTYQRLERAAQLELDAAQLTVP